MTDISVSSTHGESSPLILRPRVLIADDSRIVRATLTRHIQGLFDFREAVDGEQAWEMLVADDAIRVLITDLTMPRLDGYGLLARMRSHADARIRDMPVVVVSGSDDQTERDNAKRAGAMDLITKGIDTAQLVSRLDILAKLVTSQQEYERSLSALARGEEAGVSRLQSPLEFRAQADSLLAQAARIRRDMVLLALCLGQKNSERGPVTPLDAGLVQSIGRLLRGSVRQSDALAKTGSSEFMLATISVQPDAARGFSDRLCAALAASHPAQLGSDQLVASCGIVSLGEYQSVNTGQVPTLNTLWLNAFRRGALGRQHGVSGTVGPEEERRLAQTV